MHYTPGREYDLDELLNKADSGDLDAIGTAVCLLTAEYDDEDDLVLQERLVRYLQTLVQNGKEFAFVMLADYYLRSCVVKQNVQTAISLYESAAENGERFGNECIGMLYFNGSYVKTDYRKAYRYFRKGRKKKSPCTNYALGEMYRLGLSVRRNARKAYAHYVKAAYDSLAGYDDYGWKACYRIGVAKHYGIGARKSVAEAYRFLEIAQENYRDDRNDPFPIRKTELLTEWAAVCRDTEDLLEE